MNSFNHADTRSFVVDDPQPDAAELAAIVGSPVAVTHRAMPIPFSLDSWVTGIIRRGGQTIRVVVGRGGWVPETMSSHEHEAQQVAAEVLGEAARQLGGVAMNGWVDANYADTTGAGRLGVAVYLPAAIVDALPNATTLGHELARAAAAAVYEPPPELDEFLVTVRVTAPVSASDEEVVAELLETCTLDPSDLRESVVSIQRG